MSETVIEQFTVPEDVLFWRTDDRAKVMATSHMTIGEDFDRALCGQNIDFMELDPGTVIGYVKQYPVLYDFYGGGSVMHYICLRCMASYRKRLALPADQPAAGERTDGE